MPTWMTHLNLAVSKIIWTSINTSRLRQTLINVQPVHSENAALLTGTSGGIQSLEHGRPLFGKQMLVQLSVSSTTLRAPIENLVSSLS